MSENTILSKYCGGCGFIKPVTEFGRHKNKPDGMQTQCKECIKKARQKWAKENPEKRRARKLRSKYGLTTEAYNDMLKGQGGKCKICGSKDPRNASYKYLVVDHCHTTGSVRGLLCDYCNVGLGRFEDDIERLKNAIKYLEKANEIQGQCGGSDLDRENGK